MSELHKELARIQKALKAPKENENKFGKFMYRSCEDILVKVKPLLNDLVLLLQDDVVMVGERVYIKATAILTDGKDKIEVSAFAREPEIKKGADESQITGGASSYARKFALGGLFAIDDSDSDPDTKEEKPKDVAKTKLSDERFKKAIEAIKNGKFDANELITKYTLTDGQIAAVQEYLS